MSRLIALMGPQGSGKSTLAEMLVEHGGFHRHGIADGIRQVIQQAYPEPIAKDEVLELQRFSGKVRLTGRELMQEVGAALRDVDVHFWLRIWSQGYSALSSRGISVVVDDVRLPSEAQMLRIIEPSALVVRVYADPEIRRLRRGGSLIGTSDITERAWEGTPFDATIDTTHGTAQDAYAALAAAIEGRKNV